MRLLILFLIIFTLFNAKIGSIVFISVALLTELWVFITNFSKIRIKNDDNKFTDGEIKIIEKYHLFFRFPMAGRVLSPMFSAIQLSVFILVPWLLFKGQYIQGIIIGLNYFVAGQIAVILNPQFFLHDNLDKNKIKDVDVRKDFEEDMHNIDSVLEKMYLSKK